MSLVFLLAGAVFYSRIFAQGQSEAIDPEVAELNRQIQDKRQRAEEIQRKQEEYSQALKQKQMEKADLANQIAIIDNSIAKAQLDIDGVEVEIDQTNLEIKKLNLEIKDTEEEVDREREHVATVLRLLYKQDQANALEILLLNDSFSEFLNQVKYLEDINGELKDGIESLKKHQEKLNSQQFALGEKGKKLDGLKGDLEEKKAVLDGDKENKAFVLEQTESSEQEYQNLVNLAKKEQAQAAAEIVSLEKLVREKLSKQQKDKIELGTSGLAWPVPKNTVTAYFHDPSYPFRYIFEHPAIDIRARQGTTIRAAASGYVARAKDAGMGYSYIMLVHGDGLATVYGHVSQIFVKEDEYVVQGQAIGLSGGMPGTPGAGRLTSGAHLHFETRLNGIPVDPLGYLP